MEKKVDEIFSEGAYLDDVTALDKLAALGVSAEDLKARPETLDEAVKSGSINILKSLRENWGYTAGDFPYYLSPLDIALDTAAVGDISLLEEFAHWGFDSKDLDLSILNEPTIILAPALMELRDHWHVNVPIPFPTLTLEAWFAGYLAYGLPLLDQKMIQENLDKVIDILLLTPLDTFDDCDRFPRALGIVGKILGESLASRFVIIENKWEKVCSEDKKQVKPKSLKRKGRYTLLEKLEGLEEALSTKPAPGDCKQYLPKLDALKKALHHDLEIWNHRWDKLEKLHKMWANKCFKVIVFHDLVPDDEIEARLEQSQDLLGKIKDEFGLRKKRATDLSQEDACAALVTIDRELELVEHLGHRVNMADVLDETLADEVVFTQTALKTLKDQLIKRCKGKKRRRGATPIASD